MPALHLIVIYLITLLLLLLPSAGIAQLFQKAGVAKWKAFVPFYNTWVMQDLGHRHKYWVFVQAVPVAGWFVTLAIYIEFVKLFNRFGFVDHLFASLFTPFYFVWLGYSEIKFTGSKKVQAHKKPVWRE